MTFVFNDEVFDKFDLENYLVKHDLEIPEYKVAVIALITDEKGSILLQRRGPKSRDEQYMLEDIGGAVEESDLSFKSALVREIAEEVGDEIKYRVDNFVAACLVNKFDSRSNRDVNWLFLLYKCTYISGNLKINEPGKCVGYEFYQYENLPKKEVALTTLAFWDYYFEENVSID